MHKIWKLFSFLRNTSKINKTDYPESIDVAKTYFINKLHDFAEKYGNKRELSNGQILFTINEKSDGIYLIKKGSISVFIKNESGDNIELSNLGEGSVIGEMSLLGDATRSASCQAISENVELLFIEKKRAFNLIDEDKNARRLLTLILSERSRNMVEFINEFSNLTALVTSGDYVRVKSLLKSSENESIGKSKARDGFKNMLERIEKRESELQTKIATLSLEIDNKRVSNEIDSIVTDQSFKTLKKNSKDLRRRLRGG